MKRVLSMASQVRIPESIAVHYLQGELLLLNSATGVSVSLDPMGTRMWRLLQEHPALHKVLDVVFHAYAVTDSPLDQDLLGFVGQMLEDWIVDTPAEETSSCR